MRVTVVGLGKLGLPLAGFCASRGHDVTGADVSRERVEALRSASGRLDPDPLVEDALRRAISEGRWHVTTSTPDAVREADVVVIVVPVHASSASDVDYSMLDAASSAVASAVRAGALVLVETTVPAGTTRRRILPLFEALDRRHGRDLWLAYSPERVMIGRVFRDLQTYPKIVGGIDDEATRRADAFYREALGLRTMMVASSETAEYVKLIESTYRDANIALANAFARTADRLGIDVTQAIAAANSQPMSHIHAPGLGVGGNCIPIYPYLYAAGAAEETELALMARAFNDRMPSYGVERLRCALGGNDLAGTRILVLGITFRPGVKDTANSPAIALLRLLREQGAIVLGSDPLLSEAEIRRLGFEPASPPAFAPCDAVIVQCAPERQDDVDWIRATGARVVVDGRNALDRVAVERAGARYVGIGR